MTPQEFFDADLEKGSNSEFSSLQTWTLGMFRLACKFAAAYHFNEMRGKPKEDSSQ